MPNQLTDELTRQKLPDHNQTIFVTGIAGFIGARVAEMLLEQRYNVVGVDNLNDYYDVRLKFYRLAKLFGGEELFRENFDSNSSKSKNEIYKINDWLNILPKGTAIIQESNQLIISNKNKSLTFYMGDIESSEYVNRICVRHKPEAIINLAARAGVRASIEDPHIYLSTNTIGCLNLLEAARKYKIKKLVLASTSSLYAGHPMPFHEDLSVNNPMSPYAASKKGAEAMCYTYYHLYKISITILRYFTVYGPAGRPDMSILRFIKCIYEENPLTIYGDGNQSRDFTFIDDIARGTTLSLGIENFETINLGGGKEVVTLKEVINQIQEKTKKVAKVNYEEFKKSDIMHTLANNDLAKSILGWNPSSNINEGICHTIEWFNTNKNWLTKIKH